jgi:hypothetical protein
VYKKTVEKKMKEFSIKLSVAQDKKIEVETQGWETPASSTIIGVTQSYKDWEDMLLSIINHCIAQCIIYAHKEEDKNPIPGPPRRGRRTSPSQRLQLQKLQLLKMKKAIEARPQRHREVF